MSADAMRFKARIRELAKEEGVPAQVVPFSQICRHLSELMQRLGL